MNRSAKCCLAVLPLLLLARYSSAAEPVVVTLRPTATVSASQVTVGDVSELRGGAEAERARLARLDLAELPLSARPVLVTQQQVAFRLQVAGLSPGDFRLEGPGVVRVSRPAGDGIEERIVAVARKALEEKLGGRAEDVAIQPVQAVTLPPLSADGGEVHLEPEVRGVPVPPCRTAVEVGIYVRGARRTGVLVYLDVKKLQTVAVAVSRIEHGETFGPANVRLERVAVDGVPRAISSLDSLVGHRAKRPVPAGRPVEAEDVEGDAPSAVAVHCNDLVHLVATVGPLQVKTRGEALQGGRVGQLIQVRNLESKATVTGRVVDGSTVEVEY